MFEKIYEKQVEWSRKTFGPPLAARSLGVVDHLRKELNEIEEKPLDLAERIDAMILAFDGAWRCAMQSYPKLDSEAVVKTIEAAYKHKMKENQKRQWPDWKTADPHKAIEHIK